MLPRDRFVAGLAAFLVAHVCYVDRVLDRAARGTARSPSLPSCVALPVVPVVAVTVLRSLRGRPAHRAPRSRSTRS
ncbi:MAG: hypothetical protein KatS3mg009_1421 [Acidimicrobiia bacterium]|nr:MAG: hypothetical protein KatS3mg009_1421 [Acidimicrobiia bacterium]